MSPGCADGRSAARTDQYRLCPAGQKLDEACFQQTPLPFADGTSLLRWGGVGGKALRFNATDVSIGTVPAGSTWRRSPLPRGPWDWRYYGPSPQPVCEEPLACKNQTAHPSPAGHDNLVRAPTAIAALRLAAHRFYGTGRYVATPSRRYAAHCLERARTRGAESGVYSALRGLAVRTALPFAR